MALKRTIGVLLAVGILTLSLINVMKRSEIYSISEQTSVPKANKRQLNDQPKSHNIRRCSNAERVLHLRQSCISSGHANFTLKLRTLKYILVDDDRKLLYCSMPKTASSSMKTFLFHLNRTDWNYTRILPYVHSPKHYPSFGYKSLDSFTPRQVEYRLKYYFKYLFVRHPFERIASVWREKLFHKNVYMPRRALDIIKNYRNDSYIPDEGSVFEEVPKLSEFAEYISERQGQLNEHWERIEKLCDPCQVRYDYIVKLDSLSEDLPTILNFHGKNLTLDIAENLSKKKLQLQSRMPFSEFDEVKKDAIKSLIALYKSDFHQFGYGFTVDREIQCQILTPQGPCC